MNHEGAKLRVARKAAGMTLPALANKTHFSVSHLSNVERGTRPATPDVILAYERVLGDDVDRRGLITKVAAALVAPSVVSELLHHGFSAALAGRGNEDLWLERVVKYGQDYMSIGADELQDRLAGDLIVLQQQLETPVLWGAAARTLTVYGKTVKGGARKAAEWYRLAATASDRSDDTAVRVWVRGRSALALAYEGAGLTTAADLAGQALAISDRASLGSLNAHMALAHVWAIRGDKASSWTHLQEARRAFDEAGSSEQISDFAVPEWRMATFTSMLLSRMGDPSAVEAQDIADRTRPSTLPRFATHIQLHRGLMMAKSGDIPGGIGYARAALDALPPERHSLSLKLMMAEVESLATPDRRSCP